MTIRSEKTKQMMLARGLVPTEDLAEATTLHVSQFSRMLKAGTITGEKLGGAWYVSMASAQAEFVRRGTAHLLNGLVAKVNAAMKAAQVEAKAAEKAAARAAKAEAPA